MTTPTPRRRRLPWFAASVLPRDPHDQQPRICGIPRRPPDHVRHWWRAARRRARGVYPLPDTRQRPRADVGGDQRVGHGGGLRLEHRGDRSGGPPDGGGSGRRLPGRRTAGAGRGHLGGRHARPLDPRGRRAASCVEGGRGGRRGAAGGVPRRPGRAGRPGDPPLHAGRGPRFHRGPPERHRGGLVVCCGRARRVGGRRGRGHRHRWPPGHDHPALRPRWRAAVDPGVGGGRWDRRGGHLLLGSGGAGRGPGHAGRRVLRRSDRRSHRGRGA